MSTLPKCRVFVYFTMTGMNQILLENNKNLSKILENTSFIKYIVNDDTLSRSAPHNLRKQFFQRKLLSIYGLERYDITTLVYTNSKEKAGLMCPICNEYFWLMPQVMRAGKGCPICRLREKMNK